MTENKEKYYKLRKNKKLNDGSIVGKETALHKIQSDNKKYYRVETVGTFDYKKIFYVKRSEIDLMGNNFEG